MERGGAGRARGRRGRFTVDRLHRPGLDPVRVLLLTDHELAGLPDEGAGSLADELASQLGARAGHGVDLDVLSDLTPALKAMGSAFRAWRAWRYDAVVVLLDARGDRTAMRRIPRLLEDLAGAAVLPTPAIVAGVVEPRSLGAARHRTPEPLVPASAVRVLAEGSAVLELPDAPSSWSRWAAAIADRLVAVPRLQARRDADQDETARQQALDATGAVRRTADPVLARIVALARDAFGAESAELNVLDGDLQRRVAVAGADPAPTPRAQSICDLTIRRAGPTLIDDARTDPRTAENPIVTSGRLGFYAAHPIESIEGYRIGALCVFDSRPRAEVDDVDLGLLRDFALLAEAELIDESRHQPAASRGSAAPR